MSKVPVLQSVRAAIEFRRLHWREVSGVLGAVALGGAVTTAGQISGDRLAELLGNAFYMPTTVMACAALFRLAFRDEHPHDEEFHPGPQGFQWGRVEWRLVGVFFLVVFAFTIFAALFFFAMILVLAAAGLRNALSSQTPEAMLTALGPGGTLLITALGLGMLGSITYMAIRVSLAQAATVSRGRISVFETWRLTKGQFLPILGATVLILLPTLLASLVLSILVSALGQPAGENGVREVAMPLALVIGAIPAVVVAFVQLPLSVGLTAYLFRGLRPPEEARR
jgi:hypothetical protein